MTHDPGNTRRPVPRTTALVLALVAGCQAAPTGQRRSAFSPTDEPSASSEGPPTGSMTASTSDTGAPCTCGAPGPALPPSSWRPATGPARGQRRPRLDAPARRPGPGRPAPAPRGRARPRPVRPRGRVRRQAPGPVVRCPLPRRRRGRGLDEPRPALGGVVASALSAMTPAERDDERSYYRGAQCEARATSATARIRRTRPSCARSRRDGRAVTWPGCRRRTTSWATTSGVSGRPSTGSWSRRPLDQSRSCDGRGSSRATHST